MARHVDSVIALKHALATRLARHKEQARYRTRHTLSSPQGAELIVDGRHVLGFCSNDYLGLANHPALIAALHKGATEHGVGSGAAHLICGHHAAHHALEEELAAFTGRPHALLFSTGYMANLGVIGALAGRGQTVHEDRLNHASLIDAAMLSGAQLRRYAHANADVLRKRLSHSAEGTLIVSDGVFSMDGDLAPLPQLADVARAHQAWLMIDDAHGLGVLGHHGRGTLEYFDLNGADVPILMGTLGKAFGAFGAFVAGSEELIETLIQRARSYIYTTALPPALAEAARVSLQLIDSESWRREHLHRLITRFRAGAEQLGLPVLSSQTPIQPLLIGDSRRALVISAALLECGILVSAIRPPSVPPDSARLRITLSAAHSEEQVDRLLDALAEVIKAHPAAARDA